jgi:histidinol-phosphatase (PHP family)
MEEICGVALERGICEIAFTEHLDLDPDDPAFGSFDYDTYCRRIDHVRGIYGDRLTILKGVEIGYQKKYEKDIVAELAGFDMDIVLGAIHFADAILYTHKDAAVEFFQGRGLREAIVPYFRELRDAARSGLFDSLAHLDVIKRFSVEVFGPFSAAEFRDLIGPVLEDALKSSTALEVNSSGFRRGLGEPFPSGEILDWYKNMGGRMLTIGSDAHSSSDCGAYLTEALETIEAAGLNGVVRFRAGEPVETDAT